MQRFRYIIHFVSTQIKILQNFENVMKLFIFVIMINLIFIFYFLFHLLFQY